MSTVTLKGVNKKYEKTEALKNVSWTCEDKQLLSILGPSGAGKTTTLKVIAGVENITDGEILLDHKVVNKLHPGKRNVAMAFESYAIYPHMNVFGNLAFPLKASKNSTSFINERVNFTAELLGIEDLLGRNPTELSGGQRQRVSLGRALVRDVGVYLLDEPISHLDAKLRYKMRAELKKMVKKINSTIIYVTHDYKEAMSLSDKIVILHQGEIHQIGSPDEIFNCPKNTFVANFLGEPPINFIESNLLKENDNFSLQFHSVQIPLPDKCYEKVKKLSTSEVIIGIRPPAVNISLKKGSDRSFEAQLIAREPQTNERAILVLKLGENIIESVVPLDFDTRDEEKLWVEFSGDQIHLFEGKSKINIMHIN